MYYRDKDQPYRPFKRTPSGPDADGGPVQLRGSKPAMEGKEDPALSADLIDGITEAVVKPADPSVRAAVIADLVHEVDEAVKWRHELDPGKEEEQSVGKLVEAAASHQQRMDEMDGSADDMPEIEDDQDKRG